MGKAFIVALQAITQEDWTTPLYMTQDAVTPAGGAIFFTLLVIFGAWFTINLLLAVLQENFQRAKAEYMEAKEAADRKSTRLNSSHYCASRMPSPARKKQTYIQDSILLSQLYHHPHK